MGSVSVGTSGYGHLEWLGTVYPPGTARDDMAARYAERFGTVELNETSYEAPSAERLRALSGRAGPGLSFSVKAHESLTHRVEPGAWKGSARAFVAALEPLRESNRLDAVLLQFPSSFRYGADERRYLDALMAALKGPPLAVEFRDGAWYNNRVFDALRERSVAVASLDLPELGGLPPVIDLVTAPLAYVRLHGRNARGWWGSDSASRYDYLYSDAELKAWARRIRGLASRAERVLVYFNNYRRGQAAINASAFAAMMRDGGLSPAPAPANPPPARQPVQAASSVQAASRSGAGGREALSGAEAP